MALILPKCTTALIKKKAGALRLRDQSILFTDWDTFLEQMDAMIDELQQSPPAVGFERVYVPGEIEQLHEERNKKNGISIARSVYEFLKSR